MALRTVPTINKPKKKKAEPASISDPNNPSKMMKNPKYKGPVPRKAPVLKLKPGSTITNPKDPRKKTKA